MTTRTRAEFALLATTLIWGGTFVVTKSGLTEIGPFSLMAPRFTIASLILGLLFFRDVRAMTSSSWIKAFILGLLLYLGMATQTIGLTLTTASNSAFITSLMVAFVPVLQVVIERRPPKIGNLAGILVVVIGLWLLTDPQWGALNVGDVLTVVCAIMFALYIVYLDVIANDMTVMQLSFGQTASAGLLAWASVALFEPFAVPFTPAVLVALGYLAILASILTTIIQTRFQKETTPTRAAVIFTTEPVIASAAAALFLGEALNPGGLAGALLILAGVLVSQLSDMVPFLKRPVWRADTA